MSILEVNNVSIRYMTGDLKAIGLKEYLMRKATGTYRVKEFWADKNITFSLEKGDMLGIIGTNGAGKSTLLKAVTGIMEPTEGTVKADGNISALLELASGFDGDLTVKENAYLRGAMLGYTRQFMNETYNQIIEFADLKEFEDRPFRQLSSGMKSRLAFSVASMVRPDILILDEVLSVGDGIFRKKSESKMMEIIESGATTILVSHVLGQIRELCNKILWLEKGIQIAFGDDVETICDRYEAYTYGDQSALKNDWAKSNTTIFLDVSDPSKYYYEPVYWATENSIAKGYKNGCFGIGQDCQRKDAIVFLWRYAGCPIADAYGNVYGDARNLFNDLAQYEVRSEPNKALAWAFKEKLIEGYADGGFHPIDPVTRKDVIVMLYRMAGSPKGDESLNYMDHQDLTHDSETYQALLWGVKAGIINGDSSDPLGGQIGIVSLCSREQIVTFLYRYSKTEH